MHSIRWSRAVAALASPLAFGLITAGCTKNETNVSGQLPPPPVSQNFSNASPSYISPTTGAQAPGTPPGGSTPPAPITPGTPGFAVGALTLHSNTRDAVLATQTTSDGEEIAWIGSRDSAGLPVSLIGMRKFAPNTPTVADTVIYSSNGLPSLVVLRDGRFVAINTQGATAVMTVGLPGGAHAAGDFSFTTVPPIPPATQGTGTPFTTQEQLLAVTVAVLEQQAAAGGGTPNLVPIPSASIKAVWVQATGVSPTAQQGIFAGTPVANQEGVFLVAISAAAQPPISTEEASLFVQRLGTILNATCAAQQSAGLGGQDFGQLMIQAAGTLVPSSGPTDANLTSAFEETVSAAVTLAETPCRIVKTSGFDATAPNATTQVQQTLQNELAGIIDTFVAPQASLTLVATSLGLNIEGLPFQQSATGTFSNLAPVTVPAGGTPPVPAGTAIQIVVPSSAAITITPGFQSLNIGQSAQLAATINGAAVDMTTLLLTSSNPAVVTVSPSGLVTAMGPGTAVIDAVSETGQTGATTVFVISPIAAR